MGYGPEVHNSLTSEVRFLRKQNQALNTMLAKGSRGKNWRRGLQPGAHRPLWRGEDADAGVWQECAVILGLEKLVKR